jgi:hypothetical protein
VALDEVVVDRLRLGEDVVDRGIGRGERLQRGGAVAALRGGEQTAAKAAPSLRPRD